MWGKKSIRLKSLASQCSVAVTQVISPTPYPTPPPLFPIYTGKQIYAIPYAGHASCHGHHSLRAIDSGAVMREICLLVALWPLVVPLRSLDHSFGDRSKQWQNYEITDIQCLQLCVTGAHTLVLFLVGCSLLVYGSQIWSEDVNILSAFRNVPPEKHKSFGLS
jgi:hypothetical protein